MVKFKFKRVVLLFVFVLIGFSASSQSINDLRINEVLYVNDNLTSDKFGWIELHNAGYSSINAGGCYLSIEKKDASLVPYAIEEGVTYRIPTSCPNLTTIPPQGYLVIYAGGKSSQGPDYANFDLRNANQVYLADASGKLLIDEFNSPLDIIADISIGMEVLSYKEMLEKRINGETEKHFHYDEPTPGAINKEYVGSTKSEDIILKDPDGFGMAAIAMGVVFSALILLFIIFKCIGIANLRLGKKKEIAAKKTVIQEAGYDKQLEASGEIIATISFVLKLYKSDMDNLESNILTINNVAKTYSPWSSKIYGLTQLPNKK